jgi:hypothetical protein
MKVIGYGEDALTLWALANRTREILCKVGDDSEPDSCLVMFRPSFGRRGGPGSCQFGEFDFILASPKGLHLGEAKWENSPELAEPVVHLRKEQIERHAVFSAYYRLWRSQPEWTWESFLATCRREFQEGGISKPLPPSGSLLGRNLQAVLARLSEATQRSPLVDNILLIVDSTGKLKDVERQGPQGFTLVVVDASGETKEGFIALET